MPRHGDRVPTSKAQALAGLRDLREMLSGEMDGRRRSMARGLVDYITEQVESLTQARVRRSRAMVRPATPIIETALGAETTSLLHLLSAPDARDADGR